MSEHELLDAGFTLDCGRRLLLLELHQFRTDAPTHFSRMTGSTTREANRRHGEKLLDLAREVTSQRAAVLVPPVVTYLDPDLSEETRLALRALGEATETLPRVACVASFMSLEPTKREADMDYSSLAIAWYQESLAPPIDSGVAALMKAIDWDAHAESWQP